MKKMMYIVFALIVLGSAGCGTGGPGGYNANQNEKICKDFILSTEFYSQCPRPDQHLQVKNGWTLCKCGRQIPVEAGG
jgi:hypothetical protein